MKYIEDIKRKCMECPYLKAGTKTKHDEYGNKIRVFLGCKNKGCEGCLRKW